MASNTMKPSNSIYTFSSQPKVIQPSQKNVGFRQKFRPTDTDGNDENTAYSNIMYDRRVIRGNTYAIQKLPANAQRDPIEIQRQQEARRRALARRRLREKLQTRTPEPVQGRQHIDVQTELYLEELSDRIDEADIEVQTDPFLDRPSSPYFIPQSSGKDVATQIEPNDLFDFDSEVKPIVECLVGKTIEQSFIEIMEEEELADLRQQQRQYEEIRNAELIEYQRLEEQELRLRKEKDNRIKQAEEAIIKQKEFAQKIAARAFAKSFLEDLIPNVFKNLRENGYFYDPIEREVETIFMPWLMDHTMKQINQLIFGRTILDSIIRDTIRHRDDQFNRFSQRYNQRIKTQIYEEENQIQELEEEEEEEKNAIRNEANLSTHVTPPPESDHKNDLIDDTINLTKESDEVFDEHQSEVDETDDEELPE